MCWCALYSTCAVQRLALTIAHRAAAAALLALVHTAVAYPLQAKLLRRYLSASQYGNVRALVEAALGVGPA